MILRLLVHPLTKSLALAFLGVALMIAASTMRVRREADAPPGYVRVTDSVPIAVRRTDPPAPAHQPETIAIPARWGEWPEGAEPVATFPTTDFDCACYRFARSTSECLAGECWSVLEDEARRRRHARATERPRVESPVCPQPQHSWPDGGILTPGSYVRDDGTVVW